MIYNLNHGIGWASSGVEYAQSYRANMLRRVGIPAKFVFLDMFQNENLEHMTKNIGFLDEEIIWMYTFFTGIKVAPVSFTLDDLEKTFSNEHYEFSRTGKVCKYFFEDDTFYTVYMVDGASDKVYSVEMVSRGFLIRKDYYTYCKIFSEYYAPFDGTAKIYGRRFWDEQGNMIYEESIDGDSHIFKFKDRIIYSKDELIGYMIECMNLTENDTLIIDRATGIAQQALQNCKGATIGSIVHADHFSENLSEENILWNNYYEYIFDQYKKVGFYITATDAQNKLLREHFRAMFGEEPNIVTIPVGSLDKLTYPDKPRRKHSLITASRLAVEKHCDWIVEAVAKAHEQISDITLDIYGMGPEQGKIEETIKRFGADDYIRLMGQHKLDEIYKEYEAYVSASQSEGFGLTLMEAVGSGLPIVGFEARYGNVTFIDNGKNGYIIPVTDDMEKSEKINGLAQALVKMFTEDDMDAFFAHSYEKAKDYLTEEVEKRWYNLLK